MGQKNHEKWQFYTLRSRYSSQNCRRVSHDNFPNSHPFMSHNNFNYWRNVLPPPHNMGEESIESGNGRRCKQGNGDKLPTGSWCSELMSFLVPNRPEADVLSWWASWFQNRRIKAPLISCSMRFLDKRNKNLFIYRNINLFILTNVVRGMGG